MFQGLARRCLRLLALHATRRNAEGGERRLLLAVSAQRQHKSCRRGCGLSWWSRSASCSRTRCGSWAPSSVTPARGRCHRPGRGATGRARARAVAGLRGAAGVHRWRDGRLPHLRADDGRLVHIVSCSRAGRRVGAIRTCMGSVGAMNIRELQQTELIDHRALDQDRGPYGGRIEK